MKSDTQENKTPRNLLQFNKAQNSLILYYVRSGVFVVPKDSGVFVVPKDLKLHGESQDLKRLDGKCKGIPILCIYDVCVSFFFFFKRIHSEMVK